MDEERDARWQAILDVQAEIVDQPVSASPGERARSRGRASSKTIQFNEALSGLGSWSSVQPTERRLSA